MTSIAKSQSPNGFLNRTTISACRKTRDTPIRLKHAQALVLCISLETDQCFIELCGARDTCEVGRGGAMTKLWYIKIT